MPSDPQLNVSSNSVFERRSFEKTVLRLVKGGPERLAIKAGQIDAIIDPANGNAVLLPEAQRALVERIRANAVVPEPNRLAQGALNALNTPTGVLDRTGIVLLANPAWQACAPANAGNGAGIGAGALPGANYLAACERAAGEEHVDGVVIGSGIRQVIAAERACFRYEYACGPPDARRWFLLTCTGVAGDSAARAVVSIEDISERKHAESLLLLECAVARCLAGAGSASAALQTVIRAVCESQAWDCGRYFRLDPRADVLCFDESWGVPTAVVKRFLEQSRGLVFRPGAGLTGRVYQSGQPYWAPDGKSHPTVSRTALAPETGGEGAFCFPVTTDGQNIGVLAFSNRIIREPDDRMLQTVQSIGSQLGQFLLRQQELTALRRSEARFRGLTRVSSDWHWEQDRDFCLTQWVGSGVFEAADVLGKTYWNLPGVIAGDAKWAEHRSMLAAQWSFHDFEFSTIHPDGQTGYYCISGEPVYDEAGTFSGYRGTGQDITGRERPGIAPGKTSAGAHAAAGARAGTDPVDAER